MQPEDSRGRRHSPLVAAGRRGSSSAAPPWKPNRGAAASGSQGSRRHRAPSPDRRAARRPRRSSRGSRDADPDPDVRDADPDVREAEATEVQRPDVRDAELDVGVDGATEARNPDVEEFESDLGDAEASEPLDDYIYRIDVRSEPGEAPPTRRIIIPQKEWMETVTLQHPGLHPRWQAEVLLDEGLTAAFHSGRRKLLRRGPDEDFPLEIVPGGPLPSNLRVAEAVAELLGRAVSGGGTREARVTHCAIREWPEPCRQSRCGECPPLFFQRGPDPFTLFPTPDVFGCWPDPRLTVKLITSDRDFRVTPTAPPDFRVLRVNCTTLRDPASMRFRDHRGHHPVILFRAMESSLLPDTLALVTQAVSDALAFLMDHDELQQILLPVHFWCNRGKHRSVAVAELTHRFLLSAGVEVEIEHHNLEDWPCHAETCNVCVSVGTDESPVTG